PNKAMHGRIRPDAQNHSMMHTWKFVTYANFLVEVKSGRQFWSCPYYAVDEHVRGVLGAAGGLPLALFAGVADALGVIGVADALGALGVADGLLLNLFAGPGDALTVASGLH
ncbi:hypothetical protein EJD97_013711, partial [Solanum chilense]